MLYRAPMMLCTAWQVETRTGNDEDEDELLYLPLLIPKDAPEGPSSAPVGAQRKRPAPADEKAAAPAPQKRRAAEES
jgi:hypothetical protein